MKLDAARFALAVASIWAAAGLLCALLYKAAPELYASAANFLLHTDMYSSERLIGWGEIILATAAWWALVASLAGASAALYNRMVRN